METSDLQPQHADVYERLYDVRSYTGVYRKRFELDIHDLTDAIVHDLSDTMRPNLNKEVEGKSRRPTISPRPSAQVAPTSIGGEHLPSRQSPEKPSAPSPIRLEGDPNDPHTLLRAVFHYYCRFGRTGSKGANEVTMDNANFSKLCRECPRLLDSGFSRTDVDLIFVRAKKKGERRINYTRFLDALGMIALQKYPAMALENSVPMLLQVHIAKLPCVVEFTDGVQVQSVWSRRLERADSASSSTSVSSSSHSPARRGSTPHPSPPRSTGSTATLPPAPASPPRYNRRASAPSPPSTQASDRQQRRAMSSDNSERSLSSAHHAHGERDEDEDDEGGFFFAS